MLKESSNPSSCSKKRVFPAFFPAIALAISFWVIDALVDYWVFYSEPFFGLLLTKIPPNELFTRSLAVAGLFVCSVILTRSTQKHRLHQEILDKVAGENTAILDGLADEVIYLNKNLEILWMNRVAKSYAAKTMTTDHPLHCYQLWHQRRDPCEPCPVLRGFATGQPQECQVVTPDGKIWQIKGLPVFDSDGMIEGVVEIATDITQGKQMEEELRVSERRYRTLFESLPQGVIYYDSTGQVLAANPAAERMLGLTIDQMTGQAARDPQWKMIKHDGQDFPSEEHPAIQALQTGQPVNNVLMGVSNSRESAFRWIEVNAVPQFQPDDQKPFQVFSTLHNITETRKMEERISHSEERFRALIQNSTDLITVLDAQGLILSISPSAQRMLGYPPSELTRKTFFSLLHPDDASLFRGVFLQKNRLPRAVSTLPSYRFLRKDGSWIYLETMMNNLLSEPFVEGVVLNSRDVTDRKAVEEQLSRSEREKEMILNNMSELLSYQDRGLTVQWVNRETIETLGASEDRLIGEKCYRMWPGQEDVCPGCPVIEAIACGETCEGEVITNDGKIWLVRGNPVTGEDGKIIGAVEVRLDITERKTQEEHIRYLTFHDTLTGLYNRLFFETELSRLDTPRQLPLTMIVGDVNGLKLANDAFGHEAGDRLLLRTTEFLKQSCRREDILARWGGDEFIMLLPQTSAAAARNILERIREHCRWSEADPIPVSIALGSKTKNNPEEPITTIIKQAEDLMYKVKRTESRKTRKLIFEALTEKLRKLPRESEGMVQPLISLSLAIGQALSLSQKEQEELELLALFRNLGKIALPREIMEKADPFTGSEQEILRSHPEIGYRIAQSTPELAPIAEEILSHHECWDGTGYPQGLQGEDIPLLSRILSVAEAYNTLRLGINGARPVNQEKALDLIQQKSGTLFDPDIVNVLSSVCHQWNTKVQE